MGVPFSRAENGRGGQIKVCLPRLLCAGEAMAAGEGFRERVR